MRTPKCNDMESPHLSLLFVFISISPFAVAIASATPSSQPLDVVYPLSTPDNETVYKASKALCLSCLSDALEFLFMHNLVRAAHLEFPLVWDSGLEAYAKWWAAQRRGDCALRHSFPEGHFKLGENVFWGSGSQWSAADAVKDWAAERKYYDYSSNTCREGEECLHYTQMVWRKTWRLGCARVICDGGDVFITCNYDPVGNYVGKRPY